MKKLIFISLVAVIALGSTSCKSKQSAYKSAYEKAKEKQVVEQTNTEVAPAQAPVVVNRPVTPAAGVRKERITAVSSVDAAGLKNFSVVIGSFMNKTNALTLKENMEKDGYRVILAQNEKQMYRVIVASFDTRDQAAAERNNIKAKYSPRFDDIWLLERQY